MRYAMLLALGTSVVVSCGDVHEEGSEDIVTVSGALTGWTQWVSDETASQVCADPTKGATKAGCSGYYCDNMRIWCDNLPSGFVHTTDSLNRWTAFISDEHPYGIACTSSSGYLNGVIDGLDAWGYYSDNVSVHCLQVTVPTQGTNCKWTPWFSDEGTQTFDVNPWSYAGGVAMGVKCQGYYCDNMSYYICEPKCTSNLDCDGACINGSCGPY